MKRVSMLLLAGLLFYGLTACGAAINNEKACNDWKVSLTKCGGIDVGAGVTCDVYKNVTTCDISAYFKCLTDGYKCNNDIPDTSEWTACLPKAKCA